MNKENILKIAEFGDNPEITQFKEILSIKDVVSELDEKLEKLNEVISNLPQPMDHTERLEKMCEMMEEEDEIVINLNII